MEQNKENSWYIIHFYFKKGQNATQLKNKKDLCNLCLVIIY